MGKGKKPPVYVSELVAKAPAKKKASRLRQHADSSKDAYRFVAKTYTSRRKQVVERRDAIFAKSRCRLGAFLYRSLKATALHQFEKPLDNLLYTMKAVAYGIQRHAFAKLVSLF